MSQADSKVCSGSNFDRGRGRGMHGRDDMEIESGATAAQFAVKQPDDFDGARRIQRE